MTKQEVVVLNRESPILLENFLKDIVVEEGHIDILMDKGDATIIVYTPYEEEE